VLAVAVLTVATSALSAPDLSGQGRDAMGRGTPYLNTIIERFEADLPSFNNEHWCNLPGIEHNPFAYPRVQEALAALRPEGSTKPTCFPVVRIDFEGFQQYNHITTSLLNVGLGGIIVPMLENVEEFYRVVVSMRHPPQRMTPDNLRFPFGKRGWNPGAAVSFWGLEQDQYATIADVWPLNPQGELMAMAMIETPNNVHEIRNILSVPGLSAVLVGQGDLSIRTGVGTPGAQQYHPEVEALVAEVAAACVSMRKLCGSYQSPPDGQCPDPVCGQQYRVKQGFRIFTSGRGNYTGP
jgi:2-keto-3-deoxy-L-rhamnonate aldolase RhmA